MIETKTLRCALKDTDSLAILFSHAYPLAHILSACWPENTNFQRAYMEMEAKNGPSAERLAACHHECGHAVVSFGLGASVTRLALLDRLNGICERSIPDGWTWHDELVVTAAGAAAKIKHRKATATLSLGLDHAGGDVGKFVFLNRLVNVENNSRIQRFFQTESEEEVFASLGELVKAFSAGIPGGDQRPFKIWLDKVCRNPRIAGLIRGLWALMLNPPTEREWQGWNEYVAAAKETLDVDWAWRSVEQLATELDGAGEVRPDRANNLLQAQRERANGSSEGHLPSAMAT